MKKIIFVIMMLIPLNVFAYTGPLDDEFFNINNQTSSPYSITIGSNSTTDVTFKLDYFWTHSITPNPDLPGSYLFVSIESNKKLDIYRKYNFGSNCSSSCFSNDDYLYLVNDDNGYSYVYYFNIVKWQRVVGTQVDQFSISDVFTFKNLESGTATVYLYGSYSNTTNEIPSLIDNVETRQQIIIGNESIESALNNNTNAINNNLQNCGIYNNTFLYSNAPYKNMYINNSGNVVNFSGWGYYSFIEIAKNISYTLNFNNGTGSSPSYCLYNENKSLISCQSYGGNNLITFNSGNAKFISFSLVNNNLGVNLKSNEDVCTSKIDDTTKAINDTNQSINDMNDTLKDSTIDNPNSDFSDMEDMIAQNGVITNLIALPITLYSSILNGLNQNCTEYNFGNLFGSDLKFQCINLGALLGSTIWGVIDVLFSGFTIYAIAKKMIKVFNNFSGLQEGDVIDD